MKKKIEKILVFRKIKRNLNLNKFFFNFIIKGLNPSMKGPKPKEKQKPSIPMKGVSWTTVKISELPGTIWEKVHDEKISLDREELENLFGRKPASNPQSKPGANMTSTILRVEKTKIIDANRSKNVALILGKIKLSNTSLVNALYECDDRILTLSNIESLLSAIPTESEYQEVKDYEGDKSNLDDPEQFFLEIGAVKGYQPRLQGLRFLKICSELIDDLNSKVSSVLHVFQTIPVDEIFIRSLEALLAIGNYLNGTGAKGGAYGFKMDFLEKFIDVKGNVPKSNMLGYCLELLEKLNQGKEVVISENDFKHFDVASKLSHDKIEKKLTKFVQEVSKNISELEEKCEASSKAYLNSCKFLLEDPKESSEKLAYKILNFWNQVRNLKKELDKQRQQGMNQSQIINNRSKVGPPPNKDNKPNLMKSCLLTKAVGTSLGDSGRLSQGSGSSEGRVQIKQADSNELLQGKLIRKFKL